MNHKLKQFPFTLSNEKIFLIKKIFEPENSDFNQTSYKCIIKRDVVCTK